MALLTVQPASKSGTVVNFVAASAGGDTVHNPGGNVRLKLKNGAGAPMTATVHAVHPCDQGSLHDLPVTIGAGAEVEVALPKYCDHQVNGTSITYSSATSVTVAATA